MDTINELAEIFVLEQRLKNEAVKEQVRKNFISNFTALGINPVDVEIIDYDSITLFSGERFEI